MRLKEFIPPVVYRTLRPPRPVGYAAYPDYASAQAACGAGYQADWLVETVLRKTITHCRTHLDGSPVQLDLASLRLAGLYVLAGSPQALTVLDVGGACGLHYFTARRLWPAAIQLRWAVVETPAMAARAGEIATADLQFFPDVQAATNWLGQPDLVFTSGTLQCVPDPIGMLRELAALRARHLFLTRVAMHDGPAPIIFIQTSTLAANGPGPLPADIPDQPTAYPVTVEPRARFEAALADDYEVTHRFDEERNVYQVVNAGPIHLTGLFARLKLALFGCFEFIGGGMEYLAFAWV